MSWDLIVVTSDENLEYIHQELANECKTQRMQQISTNPYKIKLNIWKHFED
jgi:hypothetical protein